MRIILHPDFRLKKATNFLTFDEIRSKKFISTISKITEFLESLRNATALSSTQISNKKRFFVINSLNQHRIPEIPLVIINPILKFEDEEKLSAVEGCLSFPGLWLEVERYKNCTCKFLDVNCESHEIKLSNFWARVFQHEVEHLDGKLFIDNISDFSLRFKSISSKK